MKAKIALEVEEAKDYFGNKIGVRALVWDIDEETNLSLLVGLFECEEASDACHYATLAHPDISWAKKGKLIEQPDAITVGEAARAMAGIW